MKKMSIVVVTMFALIFSSSAFAQDDVLTIITPSPWITLRGDSVSVSLQADMARLPRGEVALRLNRHAGGRAGVLFNRTVKVEDGSAEVFLGRLRDMPMGGTDYISLEWSVPGTEFKGTVSPIGASRLVDTPSPLSAARLADGVTDAQAAETLSGVPGSEVGGVKFAAGWNGDALFILLNADDNISEARFAIDGKCGKNAFLSWADRFIIYSPESDTVSGVHHRRSVDGNAVKYEQMFWGDAVSLVSTKSNSSRLIKVRWYELGLQPFEERNMGFAAFVTPKGRRAQALPSAARREIPGTWGDLKLEK